MVDYFNLIDKVMDIGLDKINNSGMNIDELFRKAANGEERTVELVVYDDKDKDKILWHRCLAHNNNKLVKVQILRPTVTYKVSISAWYRLISQQNTFTDLYWSDQFEASGDYFLRDIIVWKKFWAIYKDYVHLSFFEKQLLHSRGDIA
jgi:hypothetical protein